MTFHITSHSDLWKDKSDIKLLSNMHTLYNQCQYNEMHFPYNHHITRITLPAMYLQLFYRIYK